MYRVAGIGSRNPAKIRGAVLALRLVGVTETVPVDVATGKEQPVGFTETARLALKRARESLRGHDLGVGVEAGILFMAGYPVDAQVAVVVTREGYAGIGVSPGFPLPRGYAEYARRGISLGRYMDEVLGRPGIGRGVGAVGYLSMGKVTRVELTYYAVAMALFPLINKDIYGEPLGVDELEEILKTLDSDSEPIV